MYKCKNISNNCLKFFNADNLCCMELWKHETGNSNFKKCRKQNMGEMYKYKKYRDIYFLYLNMYNYQLSTTLLVYEKGITLINKSKTLNH